MPPLPAALARPPLVWAPVLTEQAPCGRKLGVRLAPCGAWSDPALSAWVREAEGAARRQVRPLPAAPPQMPRSGLPLSCPARLVPPSVVPLEHGPLEHFQGQLAWLALARTAFGRRWQSLRRSRGDAVVRGGAARAGAGGVSLISPTGAAVAGAGAGDAILDLGPGFGPGEADLIPGRGFDGLGHEPDGAYRDNGKARRTERNFQRLYDTQTRSLVVGAGPVRACGRSKAGDVIRRSLQHGNSPEPCKSGTKMSGAV